MKDNPMENEKPDKNLAHLLNIQKQIAARESILRFEGMKLYEGQTTYYNPVLKENICDYQLGVLYSRMLKLKEELSIKNEDKFRLKADAERNKLNQKNLKKVLGKTIEYLSSEQENISDTQALTADNPHESEWQLQFENLGERIWDKLVRKVLLQAGVFVVNELRHTSKEGVAGAVVIGGAATIASLADGQIDSLEVLGIGAAIWAGMKIGEMFNSAEDFYKKGINSVTDGSYREAIASFQKAISKDKDYFDAYFQRGCVYSRVGDLKKALEDFNHVILLAPNYFDAYKKRANIHYATGHYKEIVQDCNFIISNQPDWESHYTRGLAHFALKNRKALEDFSQAIKLNPKYALSYVMRGNVYLADLKNPSEAVRDFSYAIKLEPNLVEAYLWRARAYSSLNQHSAAIQNYNQAIKLGSKDTRTDARAGRCLSFLALNKKWEARLDAFASGFKVKGLGLTKAEMVGLATPCLVIPIIFTSGILQSGKEKIAETNFPLASTTVESPVPIKADDSSTKFQEGCIQISQAIDSSIELRSTLVAKPSDSKISSIAENAEGIVKANSRFVQQLSNLTLEDKKLHDAQNLLLKLSKNIYLAQYNKLRILEQLQKTTDASTRNLLMREYKNLDDRNQELTARHGNSVMQLEEICKAATTP